MDGILIIDKPAGFTSHDVVARVRRILGTKRVGHTGTLDPFATGVLVLLVGKATRLAPFIDKDEKEYEAVVQFGYETDTGDRTGNPERGMGNAELISQLDKISWEEVLSQFHGEIQQIPPMYSAKKVAGKKLYELARQGVEVERKPIDITIHDLELIPDELSIPNSALRIRVVCSAGTYIRTLAEDIGRATGTGAHLAELRRTRAGRFGLAESITLEQLEQNSDRLRPLTDAVDHLPQFELSPERAARTRDGLSTSSTDNGFADGAAVRMVDEASTLIAIGIYNAGQKIVKPKIVLV